jgi:hypothetical protein
MNMEQITSNEAFTGSDALIIVDPRSTSAPAADWPLREETRSWPG